MVTNDRTQTFLGATARTAALCLLVPTVALARPITYRDGVSVMTTRDPTMDMLEVNYTLTPQWALGGMVMYDRESDMTTAGPTVTRGWRWNYPDSQANIYAWGGAGGAAFDDRSRPTAWGGASADWEDRRWYTQAGVSGQVVGDGPDRLMHTARVGVAPYIAEAGELHSWLMLQADHTPGTEQTWSLTPMVRQFWGTNLWEVGVSTRGGIFASYMKTF